MAAIQTNSCVELRRLGESLQNFQAIRDPAWRFHRGRSVVDCGYRLRGDDRWVSDFVKFFRIWKDPKKFAKGEAERRFPDVLWAYQLYLDGAKGPRYRIEALALTDTSVAESASILGLPEIVVSVYEKLFYAVRDCADSPQMVRANVSARINVRDLFHLDHDLYWKSIALAFGRHGLLTLWGDANGGRAAELDAFTSRRIRENALGATYVRDISALNAHDVLEEWLSLRKLEIDESRTTIGAAPGDNASEFAATLLSYLRFELPRAADEIVDASYDDDLLVKRLQGASYDNAEDRT